MGTTDIFGSDRNGISSQCYFITLSGKAFSVVRQTRGRGEGGIRGPDAKDKGYHQPTEIKFCTDHHHSYKSMPDAKL